MHCTCEDDYPYECPICTYCEYCGCKPCECTYSPEGDNIEDLDLDEERLRAYKKRIGRK